MTAATAAGPAIGPPAGPAIGPPAGPAAGPPPPESSRAPARRLAGWLRSALRRPGLQTALAGAAGVVLTVAILPPPIYADSSWVWRAAGLWPRLPGDIPESVIHHALRLGTVLPTRLAQEIFGANQVAWVAASAVLAAAFTAGLYAAGRALFGWLVGAGAVLLVVIHPYFTVVDPFTRIITASTGGLLPDMPATGLFALGIAGIAVAARRTGRRQARWLLAAGLCLGLAYLVREYVALMYTVIPVAFLLLRIPLRRLWLPAVSMLAVLLFELVHNAAVYGDPLARLRVAGEHGTLRAEPLPASDVLLALDSGLDRHPLGRFFLVALALTLLGAALLRDRRLVLCAAWFASLWVPFTLLGGLLDPWQPSLQLHVERYWFLIYPPIVIGGVATVKLAVDRLRDRSYWAGGAAALAVMAVVLAGYAVPAGQELATVRRDQDWRELREWLVGHPEVDVVYTDNRGAAPLRFFVLSPTGQRVWDGEVRTFNRGAAELPVEDMARPGALAGRDPDSDLCIPSVPYLQTRFGAREQPDPATGWQVLWRSGSGMLTIWQCRP